MVSASFLQNFGIGFRSLAIASVLVCSNLFGTCNAKNLRVRSSGNGILEHSVLDFSYDVNVNDNRSPNIRRLRSMETPAILSYGRKRELHEDNNIFRRSDGEEACEGRGFNQAECLEVGCCHWSEGRCWSSVGNEKCEGIDSGDNNDDNNDDGDDYNDLSSIFKVERCDSMTWIPIERRKALKRVAKAHYCVDVFHTLVTAPDDSDLDSCDGKKLMLYTANIVAEFLDTSPLPKVGRITSPEVARRFRWDRPVPNGVDSWDVDALRIPFMHVRCAGHLESGQPLGMHGAGADSMQYEGAEIMDFLRVATHETFHMFHAEVYNVVHPELEDWDFDGTLGLCGKEANCRWYTHGENVGCTDYMGNSCGSQPWSERECVDMAAVGGRSEPGTCFQGCGCSFPSCTLREMLAEVWSKYHQFTIPDFTSPTGEQIQMFTKSRLVEEMTQTENCQLLLDFMESRDHILPLDITGKYLPEKYTASPAANNPPPTREPSPPVPCPRTWSEALASVPTSLRQNVTALFASAGVVMP